jgi:hypothetical protein
MISNPQTVITIGASPIAWGTRFQVIEQNIKINEKREIKKLSQEEKNQMILLGKGNLYYPTSLKTSKWSYTNQINLNEIRNRREIIN